MPQDSATLLDIARAARLVKEFIQGIDRAAFIDDLKTRSAVLHQLLVLGEAVKRLPMEFRDSHSEIPWSLIAGMRDKLIHEYDVVDVDEVWRTAEGDVSELLRFVEALLPSEDQ